jgi:hypothetical protein
LLAYNQEGYNVRKRLITHRRAEGGRISSARQKAQATRPLWYLPGQTEGTANKTANKKKIKRVASFFSHPRLHAARQKDTQHEAVITTPIHSSCAFSILAMTSCKTHA